MTFFLAQQFVCKLLWSVCANVQVNCFTEIAHVKGSAKMTSPHYRPFRCSECGGAKFSLTKFIFLAQLAQDH